MHKFYLSNPAELNDINIIAENGEFTKNTIQILCIVR